MATRKRIRPNLDKDNLSEMLRAALTMQEAVEQSDTKAMRRAWEKLWPSFEDALSAHARLIEGESGDGGETDEERSTKAAVNDKLIRPKRSQVGENHDKKSAKAGVDDVLFQRTGILFRRTERVESTHRDHAMVVDLVKYLTALQRMGMLGKYRAGIEAAYEALKGHPYGEPWVARLADELDDDAIRRESQEKRTAHGKAREPEGVGLPVSDETLLERLARRLEFEPAEHRSVPRELKAALPELRRRVGMNKGGRTGKKLAATVARELAESLKKSTKSRRGN